jgi:hypothetical protein
MTITHRNPATQEGFTQLPNIVLFEARLSAQARLLYSILKSYAWKKDNSFPGQLALAKHLGTTERSVRTYLDELEESGLITVERRGFKQTNLYWLEDTVKEGWQPAPRKKQGQYDRKVISGHSDGDDRKDFSGQERKVISGQDRKDFSAESYPDKNIQIKNIHAAAPGEPILISGVKKKPLKAVPKPVPKPHEPFMDNEAVIAYRDIVRWTPDVALRKEIAERVTDLERWKLVLKDWLGRPKWLKSNVIGQLDRYDRWEEVSNVNRTGTNRGSTFSQNGGYTQGIRGPSAATGRAAGHQPAVVRTAEDYAEENRRFMAERNRQRTAQTGSA